MSAHTAMTHQANEAAERRHVLALFYRAFEHDPHFAWLVPPGADRPARLRHLLNHLIGPHSRGRAELHVAGDLRAAAVWFPPPGGRDRLRERLAHLPALAYALGWQRLPTRALELQRIAALRPRAPHCYLQMLAVDPSHQRRGHGSALLATLLQRADDQQLPVCLETGNPANLSFYARHGFAIHHISSLSEGLTLWTLLRPVRPHRDDRAAAHETGLPPATASGLAAERSHARNDCKGWTTRTPPSLRGAQRRGNPAATVAPTTLTWIAVLRLAMTTRGGNAVKSTA